MTIYFDFRMKPSAESVLQILTGVQWHGAARHVVQDMCLKFAGKSLQINEVAISSSSNGYQ